MPEKQPGFDARRYFLSPDVRLRLRGEGLSPVTLCVLDALVDHDWADKSGRRKGYCWPKVETLARKVGYTDRTVQRHLGHLMRAGLIARVGNGGRSCPAVVTLNWPRIVGEVEKGDPPVVNVAQTVIAPPRAPKPLKSKNQQKAVASASSPTGAPPRRVQPAEFDAVPPPPEVKAAIDALLGRIGSPSTPSRPASVPSVPYGPPRSALVTTDRAAREAWADAQLARAKELGLR